MRTAHTASRTCRSDLDWIVTSQSFTNVLVTIGSALTDGCVLMSVVSATELKTVRMVRTKGIVEVT